ncbi:MAG: MFS transporter [Acetobacteraceae bacterium]|nr:MFS transporter [Acetobacteraceae bacterium]
MPASALGTPGDIVARIERAPLSRWHLKVRAIVGVATFFDGFDALMIGYVLPILAPQWHLTGPEIGLMVSAGFVGQMIATLLFGALAERFGRIRVLAAVTAVFAVMSCLCAVAWDYNSLLVFRTVQGFGIGAEVPIAMTYISELARAANRGRFVVLYELVFPAGLVASVLVGWFVVPVLGWRWLFVFGGVPALVIAAFQLRLPESPRWLAARGRHQDADRAMSTIEAGIVRSTGRPLQPVAPVLAAPERRASWADLFGPVYLPRTISVWALWFSVYLLNYSLVTWLPTLYRGLFHLSVGDALGYSLVTSFVGLLGTAVCAFIFDHLSRRVVFCGSFLFAAVPLFLLWYHGISSAPFLLAMATIAYFFISVLSMGTFVYTPEIYSNRVRALGMTTASTWSKLASILGPILIGVMMGQAGGVAPAFLIFGVVAVIAACVAAATVVETRGRTFEEVSP